ncbi:MAG: XdhC family protein [Kofleriaceae bacterium]
MKRELLDLAADLTRRGISFVVGTVVRAQGSSAALVGEAVLVTSLGSIHGGFTAARQRQILEEEAAAALAARAPRLISLPAEASERSTDGAAPTVELYLDPVLADPRLLLVGRSPILTTLATLARAIGYRLEGPAAEDTAGEGGPGGPLLAVISLDEPGGDRAVQEVLAHDPLYVGVIASRRRFAALRESLSRSVASDVLERIANPAGLALGAHDAGELAVGVLAQMIARRHGVLTVNEAVVSPCDGRVVTSTMELAREDRWGAVESASSAASASCFPSSAPDEFGITLRARASSPAFEARGPDVGSAAPATPRGAEASASAVPVRADEATDPVCLEVLETADARFVGRWDGRTWYFCCAACRSKFLANPLRYSGFIAVGS